MDRDDARAVRAASKGTGWAVREGTLSKRSHINVIHVYEFAGWLRLRVKPLVWDDLFWQIMGTEFSRKPSASRHFWGHNCPSPTIASFKLAGSDPQARAIETLSFADAKFANFSHVALTFADLMQMAEDTERQSDHVETEVVSLLATGKVQAACQICWDVQNNVRNASFVHKSLYDGIVVSFFERVLLWAKETE